MAVDASAKALRVLILLLEKQTQLHPQGIKQAPEFGLELDPTPL